MEPKKQPKVLDYCGASRLLGVAIGTLQAWVSTGRVLIPHLRYSDRTVRFIEADLIAWIERRLREGRAAYVAHVNESEGEEE